MLQSYQPPSLAQPPSGSLNDRVKAFSEYWDKFFIYTRNFLNQVDPTPVTAVASAASITPLRTVQPISGVATITTIAVPTIFGNVVTLLSINGFALATGGNIAAARAVAIGNAVTLYLNILDNLWYVD